MASSLDQLSSADIDGDMAATLKAKTKQTSFDQSNSAQYLTPQQQGLAPGSSSGPVGRAAQQLPSDAGGRTPSLYDVGNNPQQTNSSASSAGAQVPIGQAASLDNLSVAPVGQRLDGPASLSQVGTQGPQQNSFDATNTAARYLNPPAAQQPPTSSPVSSLDQLNPTAPTQLSPRSPATLGNIPAGQVSFDQSNASQYLTPKQLGQPVTPAVRPSAQDGQSASPGAAQSLMGINPRSATQPAPAAATGTPAGPAPSTAAQPATSSTVSPADTWRDSFNPIKQAGQQATNLVSGASQPAPDQAMTGAALLTYGQQKAASAPTVVTPQQSAGQAPAANQASSLDQFRGTGIGAGAQGGQIAVSQGADGVPKFSNAAGAQKQAASLGDLPVRAPTGPSASDNPNASLASLGDARNLGNGRGTFSQAQAGDAALATGRFNRASQLRQGYADQDRLTAALNANDRANSLTIVRDSSKPFTRTEMAQAQLDQQAKQGRLADITAAATNLDGGIQRQGAQQQLRQASRLEDLQVAATGPNSTPEARAALRQYTDPTGEKELDRQLKQADIDNKVASTAKTNQLVASGGKKAGNLPVGLQKLEDGDIEALGNVQSMATQMDNITSQIDNGTLNLGPLNNKLNAVQNSIGQSDQNSANYASFNSTMEKMRNDSLRLNKGQQTEGDATRAWNELFANTNDPKVVKQRLAEIKTLNTQASKVRTGMINSRRKNQGLAPLDVDAVLSGTIGLPQDQAGQSSHAQPQAAATPAKRYSFQEASALPAGTEFVDPSGITRIKH